MISTLTTYLQFTATNQSIDTYQAGKVPLQIFRFTLDRPDKLCPAPKPSPMISQRKWHAATFSATSCFLFPAFRSPWVCFHCSLFQRGVPVITKRATCSASPNRATISARNEGEGVAFFFGLRRRNFAGIDGIPHRFPACFVTSEPVFSAGNWTLSFSFFFCFRKKCPFTWAQNSNGS